MDEQITSSVMNASLSEMSNTKESTSISIAKRNVDASVAETSTGRKNMRKKTANDKAKKSQNKTEQKASISANQNVTDDIEKTRKRKLDTSEQLENDTEQEIEDNAGDNDTSGADFQGNKNESDKNPKIKSARKEKSENASEKKVIDNSKAMDENSENVEKNKKNTAKVSTRKSEVHPPVSEMVLDSFRILRKRNGTSVEEISKCIEEKYQVNINRIKPHIKKFLLKGVTDGLFDQINGSGGEGKFKIKKTRKENKQIDKSKVAKDAKKLATGIKKRSVKVMQKVKSDKMKSKKRVNA